MPGRGPCRPLRRSACSRRVAAVADVIDRRRRTGRHAARRRTRAASASRSRCSSAGPSPATAPGRSACTPPCSPRSNRRGSPSGCSPRRCAWGAARRAAGGRPLGVVRFDALAARFPFVATLPQAATESALGADAPEPLRGARVMAVIPRDTGVVVRAAHLGRVIEFESGIVVVAGGGGARDLVYRPGRVRVREYRDRYLMADVAAAGRPDDEVAVVNLDPAGVLESFPLPGGRRRFVAWDAPGADDEADARAERLRVALARRGEEAAAERRAGGDVVRRAAGRRAAPAQRAGVRDRRHGARGEPDRRSGHEPRSARCRDPRPAAGGVGAHRRRARRRAATLGRAPAARRRARAAAMATREHRARPAAAAAPTRCGERRCARCSPGRRDACSPAPTRWASTPTPDPTEVAPQHPPSPCAISGWRMPCVRAQRMRPIGPVAPKPLQGPCVSRRGRRP